MDMLKLEDLEPFSFDQLQQATIIYARLQLLGYDMTDLVELVDKQIEINVEAIRNLEERAHRAMSIWIKAAPKCPRCKNILLLRPILVPQGKRNLYGWRSHWYCSNNDCLYEKYSRQSVEYERRQLLRKSKAEEVRRDGT